MTFRITWIAGITFKCWRVSRYISPPEACWRLLGLSLQGKSHSVERLPVHIEGGQTVIFEEGATREEMQLLLENAAFTKLTAFFHLCELDSRARELLYHELPEFYCWKNGSWNRRRNACKVIGRMYSVSPSQGERFYLRLLLCNVRGPRSYNHIKTYQEITHGSFKDCAIARGLLENDTEWINFLQEAADVSSASQLRHLFSTNLAQCQPSNIATLYQQFYVSLSVYARSSRLVGWTSKKLYLLGHFKMPLGNGQKLRRLFRTTRISATASSQHE